MARNNFDGLRLIGALLVLVSHQLAVQWIGNALVLEWMGEAGVALFFCVSGYLVTSSWLNDPNVARFAARRALRIWPALVVVVGVTSLCLLAVGSDAALPFLRNAVFDRWDTNYFKGTDNGYLNGPLWTIPYEVACYALLAAVGWLPVRWLRLVVLATLLVGAAFHFERLAGLLAIFAAGSLIRMSPHGVWIALLASVLHPMIAVGTLAVVAGRLSWPVLRDAGRFGDLSYGTYLWAWPVMQMGVLWFGKGAPWLMGLTLCGTALMALLSWHLIEKQALKLKPRHLDRHEDQEHVGGGVAGVEAEQQRLVLGVPVVDAGHEVVAHH